MKSAYSVIRRITSIFICVFMLVFTLAGCSGKGRDAGKSPSSSTVDADTNGTAPSKGGSGILVTKLVNGYGFTLKIGETKQMTAEIEPANATDKTVEWSTGDQAVAAIDPKTGLLTAKGAGQTNVTVSAMDGSGKKDSCTVTVVSGDAKWELTAKHKATDASKPYYLYFERDAYTISVYGQGSDGYYSKLVKTISSSRGRTLNMTPTGTFQLTKQKHWYQFQIGKYWTQYCIRYTGDVYLHGPLYKEASGDTMHINEYNQIGTASTSGCLAMVTADIKWIWDNCPDGTTLEIVSGAPIGILAKTPSRIPENGPAIDPTDPEFK